MITNATLLQINAPASASPAGDLTYSTGPALSVRCTRKTPSFTQKYELQRAEIDADTKVLILMCDIAAMLPLQKCQIVIQGDQEATPQTLLVQTETHSIKAGGLSHALIYCKQQ